MILFEEFLHFFINSVYYDDWSFNLAIITLAWIFLSGFDIHLRPHSLAGDLYQSKFAGWQNFVLSSVIFHFIAKMIIKLFAMGCICHIDKVDDNDSSHIAQSQLSGNFSSSYHIHF